MATLPDMRPVRVVLPYHLHTLAHSTAELEFKIAGPVTLAKVLDALEAAYPMLAGAVRDRATGQRRPLVRFYAGKEDLSNFAPDAPLPDDVAAGREPLLIVGASAGG